MRAATGAAPDAAVRGACEYPMSGLRKTTATRQRNRTGRLLMVLLPQQSGVGDEAAKRFGLRVRNCSSGQHGIERVAQIVTGDLLARLAKGRVEVVNATAVANLSRSIDHDGLWRDRRLRVRRGRSLTIDDDGKTVVAVFVKMPTNVLIEMCGGGIEVNVLVHERAIDAARAVLAAHTLDLRRVRVGDGAISSHEEDGRCWPGGRQWRQGSAVEVTERRAPPRSGLSSDERTRKRDGPEKEGCSSHGPFREGLTPVLSMI